MPAANGSTRFESNCSKPQKASPDAENDENRAKSKTDTPEFAMYPHHHHVERFDPKEESWLYGDDLQGIILTQAAERMNRRWAGGADSLDSRVSQDANRTYATN